MKQPPNRSDRNSIRTLIDGYNLMFTYTGPPDPREGASALRLARNRLLDYLAGRTEVPDRSSTWVVFDSATRIDLPAECEYQRMKIRFAQGYTSADELLCELIRKHPHPRGLMVVSSDHQVQRVAKARKASFLDGEEWIAQYVQPNDDDNQIEDHHRQSSEQDMGIDGERNPTKMDAAQKKKWLEEFGY